jgi:large subunit ribosomal protein L18e
MAKPTGPSDPNLKALINEMRKVKEYKALAKALAMPRRSKIALNLSDIDRETKKGENIAVPYKVLSEGELTKPLHIYAWKFSKAAEKKIHAAGGKARPIADVLAEKVKVKLLA